MTKKQLVSIIVTCYNRSGMVCKALDSIYAQSYRPLELIAIDDGSKDESLAVMEAWKSTHPDADGFSCIVKGYENGKLCIARNRGLELATGELVQYVDDDDWLYPDCVAKKVELFTWRTELDVVVHQVELINAKGNSFGTSHLTLSDSDDAQLLHLLDTRTETLFSPTLMFKRDSLLAVGAWTPGLVFADDIDVVFRMAAKGARFALVDEALSAYNMHDAERQCNKVIYQLSDDFWCTLFDRLWGFFQGVNQNSPAVREALAQQADFYALRQLRWGRFASAWLCFESGVRIRGARRGYAAMPSILRLSIGWCDYACHACLRNAKKIVKRLLKR